MLKQVKAFLTRLLIALIYGWGCLWYDKKYLTGKNFDRRHFSIGWKWILQCWFSQKIMGHNRHVPWPVPPHTAISNPQNIIFDNDDMRNFHAGGRYFQAVGGKIILGKGTMLAVGTGIVTANHDLHNIWVHQPGQDVVLGEECLVSMNAVILPGVHLGPHTVVGAGAVVNKSFPEGNCVIAGIPAKKIRDL